MYGTGRKFFSLLLAWVLIFTLVPASAFAEAGSEDLITGTNGLSAINVGTDTDITEGGQDPSQEQQQGGEPELAQRAADVEVQGLRWHTVTFESNGGTAVPSKSVCWGNTVGRPHDPTKEGYTFAGWYREFYGWEEQWAFAYDVVLWDITLYAKWEAIPTYTVTFNSNGGSSVTVQSVASGSTATKPDDPKLDGHTFEGWYKGSDLGEKWIFDTDTVTEDITLYAKWEAIPIPTFTVRFNSNGGSDVASKTVPATQGGSTIDKPTDPTRAGYSFDGWYKDENLTDRWRFSHDKVKGDITLYAKWKAIPIPTFTVTFNSNGGTTVSSISGLTSGSKIIKPTDPTKTGYTFAGWYKNTELTSAWDFENGAVTQNITLYAKWEAITTYTVTFNSNGGTTVSSISGLASGSKIIKPTDPTKTGYTFAGWYKNTELTSAWDFENGTVTQDITLFAKWIAIPVPTYTVTFNSNGGTTVSSISGLADGSKITKPADPWKSGYNFGGWYKDSALTNAWNFTTDTISGNTTLYAQWYYNYIPSYYYGGCYSNYVYPYQLIIPKTGGMVSLLPYALLSASALCAAIVTKRKRDS